MLIKGTEDLRVQKTMERIDDAFCQLLLEKAYENISVTEICRRAKIQRKTFYTYYSSTDALLKEKLAAMTSDYVERIRNFLVPEQLSDITREFYLFSKDQGALYERIICSADYHAIGSNLLKDFVRKTWQDSPWFQSLGLGEQNLLLTFIYNTGAGLYRQWVEDGKIIPIEAMALIAESFLKEGTIGFSKALKKEYV